MDQDRVEKDGAFSNFIRIFWAVCRKKGGSLQERRKGERS